MKKSLIIFMPSIEGGGVEKNFFIISNYLSTKFDDISVITISKTHKKNLNKKIKLISPNTIMFNKFGRRVKFLISLYYLFKEIIKNKNAIVFCFQGIFYCTFFCKLFSTKIIIRSNSSPSGWSKNLLKNYLYRIVYGWADKIIVNSLEFKEELSKKFNLDSICIYNPLNLDEITLLSRKKINISFFKKKNFNIINVARLNEQKDQMLLLNAIDKLKHIIPIKLLIIGSGIEKNNLLNFVQKNNLQKIVKIIPFKQNPFPYILKSDLFVLTSKYEGLPNILLEALSLKKIVLSSNCPTGPKEILDNGRGGFLYKNKNIKDLINKILFIYKNKPYCKKKVTYGFKRLNRFNHKDNLEKYTNEIKLF
jgi:glycosyltransferase involved in cell wall biosynthesis